MADKTRFPQIPSTVWWGVRSILNRTPTATIDETLLGVQLDVQDAAAKAYINELRQVGIIADDGKATQLAERWRLDDTYADAVAEIVANNYPEGLVNVSPPGNADRQKTIAWFQRQGLGQGTAGNKAATYLLLSTPSPNEAAKSLYKPTSIEGSSRSRSTRKDARPSQRNPPEARALQEDPGRPQTDSPSRLAEAFPLNINVQIHISADAGTEQIESIFQAMRRYLYDSSPS